MARPKKRPNYDQEKILKELIAVASESYEETGELKQTAFELDMSPLKARKLLITAGTYRNEISDEVNGLRAAGKSIEDIQRITGLVKSSVNGYLPYTKAVYKPDELSLNAERINVYRNRQKTVQKLCNELDVINLWETILAFQKYPFHTSSGLPFTYEVKKGRDGIYNKELIVDRRSDSKSIVWSLVILAFDKAVELRGTIVKRPKALGDIRGISYIYPLLYRFGIIEVPDKTAERMGLKRSLTKTSSDSHKGRHNNFK